MTISNLIGTVTQKGHLYCHYHVIMTYFSAPLNFGEQCCIKHMVTQYYFVVNETSNVFKVI